MPKLQMITRTNGSVVFSVNLPQEVMEEVSWEKGTDLVAKVDRIGGIPVVVMFKEAKEDISNG